jgi:photosystem II stability/assembly factor-like uncharacterized protein
MARIKLNDRLKRQFHVLQCHMRFLVLMGTVLLFTQASAQERGRLPWELWLNPHTRDFSAIQDTVEQYFASHGTGKLSGYKQWKRWEELMHTRLDTEGRLTNYAGRNLAADRRLRKKESTMRAFVNGGNWQIVAPTDGYYGDGGSPGLGRVNVIAFHPTDPNTIYAGTPAGGLWRTTDLGVSWHPLTDGIPRLGISGIAIDYNQPATIYILTGDGDGGDTFSVGVLKSTDNGQSWHPTGLSWPADLLVLGYKLAIHPQDPSILLAATNGGLLRTDNYGVSWTTVQNGAFVDIEFKPDNPAVVYATTTDTFYRSVNHGLTWTEMNTGLPINESRVAISVTPANPNYIYYLAGPGGPTGSFKGLYRSVDSGSTWGVRSTMPNILDGSLTGNDPCFDGCDQATYDLAIAVDPKDPEEVITGGVNVWRDESSGGSNMQLITHWQDFQAFEYTHGDIHDLIFQDNNTLWCASDGGVYRSLDDGLTWTDMSTVGVSNGLAITQFYRIADYPGDPNLIVGGTQDNGTNKWTGTDDIWHFASADGMDCMINYNNADTVYFCIQNGGLRKTTDGGITHYPIKPSSTNGAWVTPIAMDPVDPEIIYGGYLDTIWRSDNGGVGGSWTPMVPAMTGERYSRLCVAPSNRDVIYAATPLHLYRTVNGGGSWTEITGTLGVDTTTIITGITTDVNNASDVWVTIGGYDDGNKVYYSGNSGNTWTNISGTLPNVPVNNIAYDDYEVSDNSVYLATDIGVFYRNGSMTDWVPFRNGLPIVPVRDIEVHVSAQKIRIGTFGRGIWESDLFTTCPASLTLTDANLPESGVQGYRYYQASGTITSSRTLDAGIATEEIYQAGSYIDLTEGFHAIFGVKNFHAKLGGCTDGVPLQGGVETGNTR